MSRPSRSATTSPWLVGLALVGAPVTWSVVAVVSYALEEMACEAGWAEDQLLGLSALDVVVGALTLVGLTVIALGAYVLLHRRHVLAMPDGADHGGLQPAGWALAGVFAAALVLVLIGVVTTAPCTATV
jgi:hypothetical protein